MATGKYSEWLSPDGLLRLEGWARDGLTDAQIAHNVGVNVATLYRWKNEYRDICEVLKRGKDVVDIQVENALLKRALGYSFDEVTQERIKDTGQKKRSFEGIELTDRDWQLALIYFNRRCAYCGEPSDDITKDHLHPLHNGGKLIRENVVPCCRRCNSSKQDSEWLSWFQRQKFYSQARAEKIADYISFVVECSELFGYSSDDSLVTTKIVKKAVVPDVTAQIFWLKNRRPDKWRDNPDKPNNDSMSRPKIIRMPDGGIEVDEDET